MSKNTTQSNTGWKILHIVNLLYLVFRVKFGQPK